MDEDIYMKISIIKNIYITDLIVINYDLDLRDQAIKLVDTIQEMYPHNKVIAIPTGITITSGR